MRFQSLVAALLLGNAAAFGDDAAELKQEAARARLPATLPKATKFGDDLPGVTTLTTTQALRTFIETNHAAMIAYCSTKSGICHALAAEYKTFARQVQTNSMPLKLAKVNCKMHPQVCQDEHILAFPTIRFHHAPQEIVHTLHGKLSAASMMSFAQGELEAILKSMTVGAAEEQAVEEEEEEVVQEEEEEVQEEEPVEDTIWDGDMGAPHETHKTVVTPPRRGGLRGTTTKSHAPADFAELWQGIRKRLFA